MIRSRNRATSYQAIKSDKSKRYMQIFKAIKDKKMTAREILNQICEDEGIKISDMNYVRPRITELVDDFHELIECGEAYDMETNRTVTLFRRTTKQEKMELDNMNHIPRID